MLWGSRRAIKEVQSVSKRKGSTGQIALVETRAGLAVPIERYLELTYLKKVCPRSSPRPPAPWPTRMRTS